MKISQLRFLFLDDPSVCQADIKVTNTDLVCQILVSMLSGKGNIVYALFVCHQLTLGGWVIGQGTLWVHEKLCLLRLSVELSTRAFVGDSHLS